MNSIEVSQFGHASGEQQSSFSVIWQANHWSQRPWHFFGFLWIFGARAVWGTHSTLSYWYCDWQVMQEAPSGPCRPSVGCVFGSHAILLYRLAYVMDVLTGNPRNEFQQQRNMKSYDPSETKQPNQRSTESHLCLKGERCNLTKCHFVVSVAVSRLGCPMSWI